MTLAKQTPQQQPTSIVQRQQTAPAPYVGQPLSFGETFKMAEVLAQSGLVKTRVPEQALAIILRGRECGFQPMESFEFIDMIESRPQISPRGHLAAIYRSGLLESLEIIPSEPGKPIACTVKMARKGGPKVVKTFTLEMAKAARLIKEKSAWNGYPENMCQWRALGFAQDVCFPDITGGGGAQAATRDLDGEGNFDRSGGAQFPAAAPQQQAQQAQTSPTNAAPVEGTEVQGSGEVVDGVPEWAADEDADLATMDLRNALQNADFETLRSLAKEVDAPGLRLVMKRATDQHEAGQYTAEQSAALSQIIHARKAELGIA